MSALRVWIYNCAALQEVPYLIRTDLVSQKIILHALNYMEKLDLIKLKDLWLWTTYDQLRSLTHTTDAPR